MFTQDESYIKWKLFLEGDDQGIQLDIYSLHPSAL